MKRPNKTIITLISIPIVVLLFFAPNIYGYFQFKSYCSSEGGLRVYEHLEKNVGWWAKDYGDAHVAAQLKHVAFVRYKNMKDGNYYDLRYIGGNPQHESSFEVNPADQDKAIMYKWHYVNDIKYPSSPLIGGYKEEVLSFKNDKVLVSFTILGFAWFDSNRTPLSINSYQQCFNEGGEKSEDLSRSMREIITAFKD